MAVSGLETNIDNIFILASSSPQRLSLLNQIGIIPSKVVSAEIDETCLPNEKPRDFAIRMALEKARKVLIDNPHSFILAGDTVVALGRRILGKPKDSNEAEFFLKLLSGRRHRVYSAVTLITPKNKEISKVSMTQVKVSRLSKQQLKKYIDSNEWKGRAGGYAIQGSASEFIPWINGSYSGVVGLPLSEVGNMLMGACWR